MQSLQICVLAKEDLSHTKEAKFAPGAHVSCPYVHCNFKNTQFQCAGRFPAGKIKFFLKFKRLKAKPLTEFMLNHLHANHKHRRFNGDTLDLTMVVPQVEIVPEARSRPQTSCNPTTAQPATLQTWPFVEILAHRRYFYLEAQSFNIDGHPEIFIWLWFLGLNSTFSCGPTNCALVF